VNDTQGLTETLRQFNPHSLFIITPGDSEREVLAKNAIKAGKDAGLGFILVTSVLTAGTDTIFGRQFGPIEKYLQSEACGSIKHCLLRLPIFIDNFYAQAESIRDQGKVKHMSGANRIVAESPLQRVQL
jgi:hypothetical protein